MYGRLMRPLALACLLHIRALSCQDTPPHSEYFVVDDFHYLNVSKVRSTPVLSSFECGHACLREVSCFSFNLAASPDADGKLWCELLATDKYNASENFQVNRFFHHFSILTSCSMISCKNGGKCVPNYKEGDFECDCLPGFQGKTCDKELPVSSCSGLKTAKPSVANGSYVIDPDGTGGLAPFSVFCDMSDKAGVGVTVISHDSENRTLVKGFESRGSYLRNVTYTGASLAQLASLTRVSSHCEQFIKYECRKSKLFADHGYGWLVSRSGSRMTYWGGASPGSNKCACGMRNACADASKVCNCDQNGNNWREDSGLLTHKSDLAVSQLRFGDTAEGGERGYHTLGKLRCYGIA